MTTISTLQSPAPTRLPDPTADLRHRVTPVDELGAGALGTQPLEPLARGAGHLR